MRHRSPPRRPIGADDVIADVRTAIADLRSAQKSSRGAPAYSRFVNRPLGRILAAVAHTVGLSPNAVTIVSGTVTFAGIAVLALVEPTAWAAVLVTALLVLGYALDSADGQVARLSGRSSVAGEWLDHMVDALKLASLHMAVLVCWYRFYDVDARWLLIPILFGIVSSVSFFRMILTDLLLRTKAPDVQTPGGIGGTDPASTSPAWYAVAVIPGDYGLWCLTFLSLWLPPVFIAIYTMLAVLNAALLAASAARWFRVVSSLDR